MYVDPSKPAPVKFVRYRERHDFIVCKYRGLRQISQQTQHFNPLRELATAQFADHKWVYQYLRSIKQAREPRIVLAEVIDPD